MKKALLLIGTFGFILAMNFNKETKTNLLALDDSGEKVIICHIPPGNPENNHAIEVSINAVNAHLAHGDSLGDCNGSDGIETGEALEKTITSLVNPNGL